MIKKHIPAAYAHQGQVAHHWLLCDRVGAGHHEQRWNRPFCASGRYGVWLLADCVLENKGYGQ